MINSLVEWYRPEAPPGNGVARHPLMAPGVLADAVVRLAFDGLRRA
jgi:hypothetical protein